MRAMILAAGRGERMRPLTEAYPKPLLRVGGQPLIAWHLQRLAAAGVAEVVVNIAWCGTQLREYLGDGSAWGLRITISDEGATPLDTAGGIIRALPLLGSAPFWVINGDVWCDFDLSALPGTPAGDAHLVMVANPAHHPAGDFTVSQGRVAPASAGERLTYAGIGCYRPELFGGDAEACPRLAPLLREAAVNGRVTASVHHGGWVDVGTPERLYALDQALKGAPAHG